MRRWFCLTSFELNSSIKSFHFLKSLDFGYTWFWPDSSDIMNIYLNECLKFFFSLSFSRLESKVQMLESQQRGELEDMKEEKTRLQVTDFTSRCLDRCLWMYSLCYYYIFSLYTINIFRMTLCESVIVCFTFMRSSFQCTRWRPRVWPRKCKLCRRFILCFSFKLLQPQLADILLFILFNQKKTHWDSQHPYRHNTR